MRADHVRSYLERRWDIVEQEKVRARAARYERGGPRACLDALMDLRGRFLRSQPEGSTSISRQEDLSHHVELAKKLERISNDLARH